MCIFCKIINKEIPAQVVYEDDDLLSFKDISPKAKNHVLVIPKKHISSLNSLQNEDVSLYGKMLVVGANIAKSLEMENSGYRFIINCGSDAGMEVDHLHLHILGGEKLSGLN
ncbi:MAG: histidine triad nucleotide-binding protein [Candidatus Delongbacteria bacterium]|nr:histidine triad nucleotide-binding protein [Candidatus Delongbacteria bacterium]MBN2836766.1 histidine triad nucleotide-binding protein [Candidatus Delongbacteria bacterium]